MHIFVGVLDIFMDFPEWICFLELLFSRGTSQKWTFCNFIKEEGANLLKALGHHGLLPAVFAYFVEVFVKYLAIWGLLCRFQEMWGLPTTCETVWWPSHNILEVWDLLLNGSRPLEAWTQYNTKSFFFSPLPTGHSPLGVEVHPRSGPLPRLRGWYPK